MHISRVKIENFKSFKEPFILELNEGLNIIVGNNEAGKSTILEAIHLALSGLYNGKYLKNELNEFLFNNSAVTDYINSLNTDRALHPPQISIEVFIAGEDLPSFEGDGNSENRKECGICLKIALDHKLQKEYEEYIVAGAVHALPIEYYEVTWTTCAREPITPKRIPIKSALIDSNSSRFQNGSDVYISHIIKNHLDEKQRNSLSQAHRKLHSTFAQDNAVVGVNEIIRGISKKNERDREVKLSIDLSSRNSWESSLLTYVEDVPFQHIGKGEQAIVKTKLALEHKKAKEANIVLLEEPENHLSHAKLNQLIKDISEKCAGKQIIISTHSSFVANKLGLENLVLLNNKKHTRLNELTPETQEFFRKIPGYDTLRLILCKKAILVEGSSDELVVQKAYKNKYKNLPIEDEIDVISVGTAFLRFLEIAVQIEKCVCVVTDNDGNVAALRTKYKEYLGDKKKPYIDIYFDEDEDTGPMIDNETFNYNTLEPKILKANSLAILNSILKAERTKDALLKFMSKNKTEVALALFDSNDDINFPQYIVRAVGG